MDRTHLRWFTPASYRQLFESAGFSVISLRPLVEPTWRARLFNFATGGVWSHLFVSQMVVQATANPV
jgi:hypothetical protein